MFHKLMKPDLQPQYWQKIPWHDADFSRRMLREHLDQSHNLASRTQAIIDSDVRWIQHKFLSDSPAKILDLGCGPGFYTRRLSALGHHCTGIDISPASIAYAQEHDTASDYQLADLRAYDLGNDYDFILLIYGELNAFAPEEAQAILNKAYHALKPGGQLLLEVHHHACVRRIGTQDSTWYRSEQGLFSDDPFLCLVEADYSLDRAVTHFYVITDGDTMQHYTSMTQAYSDDEYRHLLRDFSRVCFYPALATEASIEALFIIVATK